MYYLTLGNFRFLKITTLASNCRYPVVVSIAVSKMVMTELIFVNSGMKVNGEYYRDALLSPQMLPAIKHVADVAIQWRKRLRACVRADGQHFEHLL